MKDAEIRVINLGAKRRISDPLLKTPYNYVGKGF
jgi:hypothetical protein